MPLNINNQYKDHNMSHLIIKNDDNLRNQHQNISTLQENNIDSKMFSINTNMNQT